MDVGSLPSNAVATIQDTATILGSSQATLGRHLARRLVQAGVNDIFTVPGDFNLSLLDQLIAEPELNNIGCCNELNAGYAADGYARSRGVGACVVTFTVGGLSVLNAIAGAYSENLPVICIVGGPNSNDFGTNRILHHTIGLPDFSQELRCFQTVTCYQAVVNHLEDAHEQIDMAISTALKTILILLALIGEHSVGYSLLLKKEKAIIVHPDCVVVANGPTFGCIRMSEFFGELAKRVKRNVTAYENYHRIFVPEGKPLKCKPREPLRINAMFQHIQKMLSSETAVIAETGDSWFNCQKLRLPKGCGMDQLDVSTMIRNGQKTIIFLINNGGYTIEVEIHDGPYNVIKNWNYTGLVDAIHNGEGKCWTTKVRYEEELVEAINTATLEKKDSLCFIEVIVHKDDTSKELLEWGSRVSAANGRPPNPQ
ncbi:thiamine diphosphate-binding fold [Arabidopsis suecica]|uniref:Thiamine diphosphate-binding fold n=1 Tax=Arabidopsis suecica TaxID=45249 RepID=A0A8T1Z3X7_ARASU|nr:thiamine diphosphate-binding fold [Arabidopsis suecica]